MAEANSTVEYRDISGFPGYRVGDDGSVQSCWRLKGQGWGRGTRAVMSHMHWRALRQYTKCGYLQVALRRDKAYTYCLVHRLVLEAFVGPCPDGMECRHFPDRNTSNNRLENLSWGTRSENALDRVAHGTLPIGEACRFSKVTAETVLAIRAKYTAKLATQTQLAAEYGITQANVSEIVRRKTWKHLE